MDENLTALDDEQLWQTAEALRDEIRGLEAEGESAAEVRERLMRVEIERGERALDAYREAEARLEDDGDRAALRAKIATAESNLAKWKAGDFPRDNTPTARISTG